MISVQTINGGYSNLSVTDNGCGISRENFKLLAQFHATSKAENPKTQKEGTDNSDKPPKGLFGFHGASLASISCINPIVITSRTRSERLATRATFHFATLLGKIETVEAPYGTKVEICNYINYVENKKNRLQTSEHSNKAMKNLISSYSTVYYNINFKLISGNRKIIFKSDASNDIMNNFKKNYRGDCDTVPMNKMCGHLESNGMDYAVIISNQSTTRKVTFFLNGQRVKCKKLKHELYEPQQTDSLPPNSAVLIMLKSQEDEGKFIPQKFNFPHSDEMYAELRKKIHEFAILPNEKKETPPLKIAEYVKCYTLEKFPYIPEEDPFKDASLEVKPAPKSQLKAAPPVKIIIPPGNKPDVKIFNAATVRHIAAPPVVQKINAAPTVKVQQAPQVRQAPTITQIQAAPAITQVQQPRPQPTVIHKTIAPPVQQAPTVIHMAQAPRVVQVQQTPQVHHVQQAPTVHHVAQGPQVHRVLQAPKVTHVANLPVCRVIRKV